jgi:5'-3' exonuclease
MATGVSLAPVYLVDASLYIFRAYHSVPLEWHDRDGWPTNAAQGFTSFLLQLLEHARPERVAICFDEALGLCYRNEIYPAYKANRDRPDEILVRQFTHCQNIARALGLTALSHPRYEADDLIGSLVLSVRAHGFPVLVISADKDLAQLLRDGDEQWDYERGPRWCPLSVKKRFGVRPDQIADLLALAGDAIDNIPGVRGVGRLTAAKLLRHYGDLDALYAAIDSVGNTGIRGARALQARLTEQRALAFLSQQLTRIHCQVPVPSDPDDLLPRRPELDTVRSLFVELGFGPFLRRRVEAIEARWHG